jgi:putative ABC transport system substrate-binding protein
MKRREFITLIGGAVAWPLAARAQQRAMPVVAFVSINSPTDWAPFAVAFRDGLKEVGYIEGQNVHVEYRWAEGYVERIPTYMADMVRRQVAVIAGATAYPALEAKAVTTTIPIVFITGTDPVKLGLVASLNRPGGNVTGVNFFSNDVATKRLGLLHDLIPRATVIALLVNPKSVSIDIDLRLTLDAARTLGLQVNVLNASSEGEIDAVFAALRQADALVVAADPFFTEHRHQIVALAARRALPAIYSVREWTIAGGLMSYSTSLKDAYRQVGIYAGRILKGEKPADLPVTQPTKFEFVINLKTAKTLGLTVPPGLMAIADEIIE